jgi:NAD+ diphosphatase
VTPSSGLLNGLLLARATVDRGALRRTDPRWFTARLIDESTRVLLIHDGHVPVEREAVLWLPPSAVGGQAHEHVLMGVSETDVAYVAARVQAAPTHDMRTLRDIGAQLDAHDAGLVTTGVALAHWHAAHEHCARCGSVTDVDQAGWVRRCASDGSSHFPRTDPAVIALVRRGDQVLLGRRFDWPAGRFSTFAGFVEPGESSEMALDREIYEECGLRVDDSQIQYRGSQPWPFPASLMIGYEVGVLDGEARPDGEEIVEVRWFTRDSLRASMAIGEVTLPPPISIARRLIERWLNDAT